MKTILTYLFLVISSFTFSQEGPDSTYIIRDAGFSVYDDYDKVRDSIASKNWNIQYWTVGNCYVSFEFQDSIKIMNDKTYENLALKYGQDWEKRFLAEVDTVYKKLIYDREYVYLTYDTIENENFYIPYSKNYYSSKYWFTIYSKKGVSSSNFSVQKRDNSPTNHLFRGIENILLVEFPFKNDTTKYYLSYEKIGIRTIEFVDSTNSLVINTLPGQNKSAKVEIKNDFGLDTTLVFTIINLPKPILCLNTTKDGERINNKSTRFELSLKAPEEFNFNFAYDILSWELNSSEKKRFVGPGNVLSKEAIDYIRTLIKGTKISFVCQIKGPKNHSDVVRKLSGEFIIQ
jgi:hypothetical protein